MIDFNFNNTRNFAIADVHGLCAEMQVFKKILTLFDTWIVQVSYTDDLLEVNRQIQDLIGPNLNPLVIILVRDSPKGKVEVKNLERIA